MDTERAERTERTEHIERTERTVLVLPGFSSGPFSPILSYAVLPAERREAEIHRVHWYPDEELDDLPFEKGPWVMEHAVPAVDALADRKPLLVGASMGTRVAPVAAERGLPAVWLTPPLTTPDEWVPKALAEASAPFMLVGGTADELWDGGLARSLTQYVLEVPGADHRMLLPGAYGDSAAVLALIAERVERFLAEVVWGDGEGK